MKMKDFLAVCILFGTLAVVVNGQSTCPASSIPLFSLAATRAANQVNPNQYFLIGGLFDVHKIGTTAYNCSQDLTEGGFIRMLAFFWSIDKYFTSVIGSKLISVGAIAFDSCMRPDQTIQNMYDYAQCRINVQSMEKENLVAYVGPYTNKESERAGSLANDLGITVFSPMADTDKINFMEQKTLLKMRPSFVYDLKAIMGFLNSVQAPFVIILYASNDTYSREAYNGLTSLIKDSTAKPCIQYTADIANVQVDDIINSLSTRMFVKYIVPLMSRESLDIVMFALFQKSQNFIFIINSRIGRDLQLMTRSQATVNSSIIIEPSEPNGFRSTLSEFSSVLRGIQINNTIPGMSEGVGNAWLSQFLARPLYLDMNDASVPSPLAFSVYRTIMSVQAVIKGMDEALKYCSSQNNGNYQFCGMYRNQENKAANLYQRLRNSTDTYMSNSGDQKYENSGYSYYIFSVYSGSKFVKIGDMVVNNMGGISNSIVDLKNKVIFENAFRDTTCPSLGFGTCCEAATTTVAPTTASIATRGTGSTMTTQTTTSAYSQVLYPTGQAITGAYSSSYRKDSEYGTRFDLGHKWIIALGVLAGLGILCVFVFEIFILYKLLGKPEGSMWRTMWLGQLLLFGVFLCYLVLFAYLPVQTKATCGITRFGVGVSYAFCFAVLLVKLMIILTSKPPEMILPGDVDSPNYLKGTYQFLLFLLAFGVQVVIDVQWLITVPPEAVLVTSNNGERVWICNHYTWQAGSSMDNMATFVRTEFENHLMSLIYIMVLILITTILSLKAHGIITNHRESVFVGIAAGFTIPIWLAWGLVGGLNKSNAYAQEFGDACIAFGLLITATLILFSMFLPKVRHLSNMGVEGIYVEDEPGTIYGDSVILAPSSYKSRGSGSVIHVNQGIYSDPVVISNGDPMATHLKHPGSVYSAPGTYLKHPDSVYGVGIPVLRVADMRGRHPQKYSQSELAYGTYNRKPRSAKGTLPRARSQTNLGAL